MAKSLESPPHAAPGLFTDPEGIFSQGKTVDVVGGLTTLPKTSGGSDFQPSPKKDLAPRTCDENNGGFSPSFTPLEPRRDKTPCKCQMSRSLQVASPPSQGIFLTPQVLLTHRRCRGAASAPSSAGEGRWARQSPGPTGREMLLALTHPSAAFRRERQQLLESRSLSAIFCLPGSARCHFPPGGQRV